MISRAVSIQLQLTIFDIELGRNPNARFAALRQFRRRGSR
jgi:hypothetical protein